MLRRYGASARSVWARRTYDRTMAAARDTGCDRASAHGRRLPTDRCRSIVPQTRRTAVRYTAAVAGAAPAARVDRVIPARQRSPVCAVEVDRFWLICR